MEAHYTPLVHWKTDDELPLWQLQRRNRLRINITSMFDAKFLVSAVCGLSDEEAIYLRGLMESQTIPCKPCAKGFMGYDNTIFEHTSMVGEGWGWHVTNNAMEAPGFTKAVVDGRILNMQLGNDFKDHVAKHPKEGYTVQFENVPWTVFKRYWRKPIHLDRQFHGQKIKTSWRKNHGYPSLCPAIDNLHFDRRVLVDYKCIFADFNRTGMKDENPEMTKWMLKYSRAFRMISDDVSPFVKDDAELLFTLDWMKRLP